MIQPVWSVILAGGDGQRTQPFIQKWLGRPRPKQYCTFLGSRSLFQHTVDRADRISPPTRRVTVVADSHRSEIASQLDARNPGKVVYQPQNLGTAPGIYLALTYVKVSDPDATVVVYPSDHFVHPEERFVAAVQNVVDASRKLPSARDPLILLGIRPECCESDYGWIRLGTVRYPWEGCGLHRVGTFVEKPSMSTALEAMARGDLWNSMILIGHVGTFWRLGRRHIPEVITLFDELAERIDTPAEASTLERVYRSMFDRSFSYDVLQRAPEDLLAAELSGVHWSDWGRPERIAETIRRVGGVPCFPDTIVGLVETEVPGTGAEPPVEPVHETVTAER